MILKTNCSNILSTSSVKLTSLCVLLAPVSLLAFLSENVLPNFLQQYLLEFSYFSSFLIKSFCFQWEEALTKWPVFSGSCSYGAAVLNRKIVPSGPIYLWDALSELVSRSKATPYPSPELTPVSHHLIIPISASVWSLQFGAAAPLMHLNVPLLKVPTPNSANSKCAAAHLLPWARHPRRGFVRGTAFSWTDTAIENIENIVNIENTCTFSAIQWGAENKRKWKISNSFNKQMQLVPFHIDFPMLNINHSN